MYFRSIKKCSQDVSISDPIDTDKDGNTLTLIDVITDNRNLLEELDLKLKLEKLQRFLKEELTEREMKIIALRYGLGGHKELAQREVAQVLDISRSYVSRIEKKALQKLRTRFEE